MSREDAAFNLGRMGLLVAGLADHRLLSREATEDRLHQGYRSPLFPEAPMLLSVLVEAGVYASCWSGAGPSLLGICSEHLAPQVRRAALDALAANGVRGQVLVLRADRGGLVVGEGRAVAELPAPPGERLSFAASLSDHPCEAVRAPPAYTARISRKFIVRTFGCQMNEHDSERLADF